MPDDQRTQPEYSLGERLRGIESELAALDRRFDDITDLFDEKLNGMRRELQAINSGLKDSVEKAQTAQQRQFSTYVEASDRKAEIVAQRLAALERGEASSQSEKQSIVGLQNRQIALVSVAATVILALIAIISTTHPFG